MAHNYVFLTIFENIQYFSARSIKKKIPITKANFTDSIAKPQVIAITEAWLSETVLKLDLHVYAKRIDQVTQAWEYTIFNFNKYRSKCGDM